jgi:hypothetical protein
MKFLAKNLYIIYIIAVVIPFIIILLIPLGACGDNGILNFLGGRCSGFVGVIPGAVAILGSLLTILLNIVTKKTQYFFIY